jgi:rhomboid family GlyGly-CTERM serine protease
VARHLHRLNAWVALAGLHMLAALLAWPLAPEELDWQPGLAVAQPWRALSGAWVHWSLSHLLANLAGCAVLAWLGWRARLATAQAIAWLAAWPLTQALLLAWPALQHFGGLSGVLHAGVAITAIELLSRNGRERLVGTLLGAGLLVKLTLEAPLGPTLRQVEGWDIAIAPVAHLSGVLAGAICALALRAWRGRRRAAQA